MLSDVRALKLPFYYPGSLCRSLVHVVLGLVSFWCLRFVVWLSYGSIVAICYLTWSYHHVLCISCYLGRIYLTIYNLTVEVKKETGSHATFVLRMNDSIDIREGTFM